MMIQVRNNKMKNNAIILQFMVTNARCSFFEVILAGIPRALFYSLSNNQKKMIFLLHIPFIKINWCPDSV